MKSVSAYSIKISIILCLSIITFGCSGSGSSSTPAPTPTTTVSGVVLAGPASGTTVTVKTAAGAVVATTTVPTDANGAFTVAVPTSAMSGDLVFEASGGTFPDEATATPGVALGTLTAHTAAGTLSAGANVTIDPSSTIIQKLVAGGKNKADAEAAFAAAFGFKPDCSIKPAFATMSSASSNAQRLVGLRAAAFSQLTKDMSLAPDKQSELVQALADDLSDGKLDGKKGADAIKTASGTTIPEDICNKFSGALVTFVNDSGKNKSKLTIDKIDAPTFNKTALTASYKVEYVPGMMAAAQGKTTFKIKASNLDGTPATGKAVTLTPKMNMATMSHSAPVDTVVESATPGTYDATAYYLMASGPGMGVWELKVNIGGETATFYPAVAMAMGTTSLVKLTGISDTVGSMTGGTQSGRAYRLFNDGIAGTTAKLFIAAADDSMMMKFPAVSVGTILTGLTVSTMAVEVSTDKINWTALTDNGNGHWSTTGITTLSAATSLYVRLTINGEQKTTDGKALAADGTNGFQTFTITAAGGMVM